MAQNMLPSHHDERIPSAVQGQGQPSNRPDLNLVVAGYDEDGSGMHAQANIYHLVSTWDFAPSCIDSCGLRSANT
jgi:hypothetical protein